MSIPGRLFSSGLRNLVYCLEYTMSHYLLVLKPFVKKISNGNPIGTVFLTSYNP